MKTLVGLVVCIASLSMVPAASAVTVDLASLQEVPLVPGDTLGLSLTVANETEAPDLAMLVMDADIADGPNNVPGISHKPIRIKLAPSASETKTFELILPLYKQLPAGEYTITISVTAKGLISKTESSDSISFVMIKE